MWTNKGYYPSSIDFLTDGRRLRRSDRSRFRTLSHDSQTRSTWAKGISSMCSLGGLTPIVDDVVPNTSRDYSRHPLFRKELLRVLRVVTNAEREPLFADGETRHRLAQSFTPPESHLHRCQHYVDWQKRWGCSEQPRTRSGYRNTIHAHDFSEPNTRTKTRG
ncbi:hypothetical protein BDM02DRAFT_580317 [Thelephora ganbajun]|uniref:Uncharacterized protein n=1 Tax=Thelephora ganbajun TaxID=370292 RepID=A0ACB6Z769_THEGA|nr:hypothetical protein BDM02DRAFT_580317 [Thelephora ganbajun]